MDFHQEPINLYTVKRRSLPPGGFILLLLKATAAVYGGWKRAPSLALQTDRIPIGGICVFTTLRGQWRYTQTQGGRAAAPGRGARKTLPVCQPDGGTAVRGRKDRIHGIPNSTLLSETLTTTTTGSCFDRPQSLEERRPSR